MTVAKPPKRDPLTVVKGEGWREYVEQMPKPSTVAVGTVKVSADLEGALVLDLDDAKYKLLDKTGAIHDLDYTRVRNALYGVG